MESVLSAARNIMKVKLVVKKYTLARVKRRRGEEKLGPVWWIEGLPYDECGGVRCGPYTQYADADSDRVGMQRIFDDGGYK